VWCVSWGCERERCARRQAKRRRRRVCGSQRARVHAGVGAPRLGRARPRMHALCIHARSVWLRAAIKWRASRAQGPTAARATRQHAFPPRPCTRFRAKRRTWPTRRSPVLVNATTLGVVRPPSLLGTMVGLPPSIAATAELVVPKSMPTTCVREGARGEGWG
jgi:hypothetical protein